MTVREMYPVGTRVKPRFDKTSAMRGTVVGYGRRLYVRVQWDGQNYADERLYAEVRTADAFHRDYCSEQCAWDSPGCMRDSRHL